MKQAEILQLMQQFEQSTLCRMEYEQEGCRLCMEKAMPHMGYPVTLPAPMPAGVSSVAPTADSTALAGAPILAKTKEEQNLLAVKAPLVGVFYHAKSPDAPPFVQEGDTVSKGQVLCLIEAMKMMNELASPVDGVVKRVHGENGEVVSYGELLFEVCPC